MLFFKIKKLLRSYRKYFPPSIKIKLDSGNIFLILETVCIVWLILSSGENNPTPGLIALVIINVVLT